MWDIRTQSPKPIAQGAVRPMDTSENARPRVGFGEVKSLRSPDNQCVVTVDLTDVSGKPFEATCEGRDSPTAQLESAATAAIRALETAADHRIGLGLERITETGELNTVVVHLSISRPAGDNVLLLNGSGFVNGQPLHAAVKATLQATNRLFETGFVYLH